jgi:hypothetical protein
VFAVFVTVWPDGSNKHVIHENSRQVAAVEEKWRVEEEQGGRWNSQEGFSREGVRGFSRHETREGSEQCG